MIIEANVTINLPDNVDPENLIKVIDSIISGSTGNDTEIHITEMDDPLTTNPIGPR